jgi:hypothetical protein
MHLASRYSLCSYIEDPVYLALVGDDANDWLVNLLADWHIFASGLDLCADCTVLLVY